MVDRSLKQNYEYELPHKNKYYFFRYSHPFCLSEQLCKRLCPCDGIPMPSYYSVSNLFTCSHTDYLIEVLCKVGTTSTIIPVLRMRQWKHKKVSQVWLQQVRKANFTLKEVELPVQALSPSVMETQ